MGYVFENLFLRFVHAYFVLKTLPEGEDNGILIEIESIGDMGAQSAVSPFGMFPMQILLVFFSGTANRIL